MPASPTIADLSSAQQLFTLAGILGEGDAPPAHLQLYIEQTDRVLANVAERVAKGEMTNASATEFAQVIVDACATVLCHPIVASNRYLERFAKGVTFAQARHELQQFSVFAAQFDVAQAKLVANAPTYEAYLERLNVLLNEKGIPFEHGFEGELTGRWSLKTVHFSWLQDMATALDLRFEDIAKIWIASPGTKAFVDATFNQFASTDQNTALGASFAIENWAANSLWKPWIAGMNVLNKSRGKTERIPLGYLSYHNKEEEHHSQATLDELLENFQEPWFSRDEFLAGAERILNEGVQAYYDSQLATLPDRDASWPEAATHPRRIDPKRIPRLSLNS